uniref:beta strand repeat-containing protein n=1 Tax=Sandarakinorhabdus rubra TaxID=2672568 RepID=UPI0038B51F0C
MRRLHLRLASPAALAAALLLAPPPLLAPAMAQAFLGTPTIGLGNVNRVTGPGNETITVDSPQATINWLPNDVGTGGPINFLPAGNSALFQSATGNPYTVLNRIIAADPTRAIALSGLVSSDPVGNVWFYAPGGLLIGGTAQFDVGGLLLTTNDPVGAAAGTPFIGAANDFRLAAASGSTGDVSILPGASLQAGNYVIAVAPRIVMNGAINLANSGGSAALVVAEDVSITLNGGLFDITANVGSVAGGTNTVNGSITGVGGLGGQGVYSRIYMMAVPRNVGMTLLISGGSQLGFDVANAADVDGNAIVLSGGYDIVATPLATGIDQFGASPVAGAASANIVVDNRQVTSNLTVRSNDRSRVLATLGNTAAAANVELFANGAAEARASGGFALDVVGDLRVDGSFLPVLTNGQDGFAGSASVLAQTGGRITAGGNILAFAVGAGEAALSPLLGGGDGLGSIAFITVDGAGSAISAQSLFLDSSGIGGAAADGAGGSGTGGFAQLRVATGGSLTVNGVIEIRSQGVGELGAAGYASGNAQGNAALLELEAGTSLNLGNGGILLAADGLFAERTPIAHTGGGTARGGIAEVRVQNGATLNALGLVITADAAGPAGGGGNSFIGGSAGLLVDETTGTTQVTLNDDVIISAQARATSGAATGNINGGGAVGGQVQIASTGGASVTINGQLSLIAQATAGSSGGGTAGSATGGGILVGTAGSLSVTSGLQPLLFNASGSGGDGGSGQPGGDGTGGSITVVADPGATLRFDSTAGGIALFADGQAGASGTQAGNALGGQIDMIADGTITLIGNTSLSVDAFSGFAPVTGTATAGDVVIDFGNTGLIDGTGSLLASAQATGRTAIGGSVSLTGGNGTLQLTDALGLFADASPSGGEDGASGTGGTVTVTTSDAGQLTVGGVVELTADAALFSAGNATSVTGGTVRWQHRGNANVTGSVTLSADAGYFDGGGGTATGGNVGIDTLSGSLASGALFATANASSGALFALPSGAGTGGSVTLTTAAGSSLTATGQVQLQADGVGATLLTVASAGGAGQGGSIALLNSGDMTLSVGNNSLIVSATGTSGASELGAAGLGQGGSITLDTLVGGSLAVQSTAIGPLLLDARGIGNAALGAPASVTGGSITVTSAGATSFTEGLSLLVGGGITGGSGTLRDVTAGSASLTVSGGTTGIGGNLVLDGAAGGTATPLDGNAQGGAVSLLVSGGTLQVPGNLLLLADGAGGGSGTLPGGSGLGGTADLAVAGGTLNVTGTLSLTAVGAGGSAVSGGTGVGGAVSIDIGAGSSFPIGGQLLLDATGAGGNGFSGPGGAGTGGAITLAAAGGGQISAANPLLL